MCGIYGIVGEHPEHRAALARMANVLFHRGPDGEGEFVENDVALGMRRLSIIDLTTGQQPFFSADRSIVAFCNGEIYNYRELRAELQAKGVVFGTLSDVEVLPHLYKMHGIDFVQKLNGMFAIALYDAVLGRLFLIRDRLGIKPLYYAATSLRLTFASELKALREIGVGGELDFSALSGYLDLMYVPHPLTPFQSIKKLPGGAYLCWERGNWFERQYWDPKSFVSGQREPSDPISVVDGLLSDSVGLELRSDVPVGSFLSGGVDSSLVTAIAACQWGKGFPVFHMRWNNVSGKTDESQYALQVASKYQLGFNTQEVRNVDLPSLLPKLIWFLDEPLADAAFVPTYLLSQMAGERVKVVLSGAGGDELFGGYEHYRSYSPWRSLASSLLRGRSPARRYFDVSSYRNPRWLKAAFPWYKQTGVSSEFEYAYRSDLSEERLNDMMAVDLSYYLQDDILAITDRMTMAASIECRVPLLDHRFVELALGLPGKWKIQSAERKVLLKKVAERYIPKEALYRPKEGFGSPIWIWVNQYKDLYFDILLEDGYLVKNSLIRREWVDKWLGMYELSNDHAWMYWRAVVLEIWLRLYLDRATPADIFGR